MPQEATHFANYREERFTKRAVVVSMKAKRFPS